MTRRRVITATDFLPMTQTENMYAATSPGARSAIDERPTSP
jgi:hypothetical protein